MYWHNRQWFVIESVVDLAVEPFLFDPLADPYSQLWCNTDQAGIEKPMEVRSEQKSIPNIMSALS